MTAKNARSLFLRALDEVPPEKWATFLDEECGNDHTLRGNVQRLLAAQDGIAGFMDQPAVATIDMPRVTEKPGTQIGPYKLLQQIGEGGFGVVYMAEQHKPVRRKVALKIIKPGMDTKEVIARFEAERQALALMDHPNIAKVLDAGATESGRPYFVMELVRGVPITEFCDEQKLSTRERLNLFVDICRAIQHAHQKGIIHRDLKPTNVMVTLDDNRPIPKVIDFGISKALSQQLTEKTLFTGYGQMVGTPLYMAPEQAQMSMRDVDTRSDVYSLGVLLYELLTGTTPFDKETLQKSGFDEMRRIICEVEPPRPSARISTLNAELLSTVSDKRKVDSRKLSQSLRGELDWIVMKALEKDRNQRYESASAFAADVERYLNDEPVQARPASVAYRLRKFARKNRTVAIIAALSVLLFAAVVVSGIVMTRHANEERRREYQVAEQRLEANRSARDVVASLKAAILRVEQSNFEDANAWSDARELAERARMISKNQLIDPSAKQTIDSVLSSLSQAQKDRELCRAVASIHTRIGKQIGTPAHGFGLTSRDVQTITPGFAEALGDFGIDIDSVDPSTALDIIRRSKPKVQETIRTALDEWDAYYRGTGSGGSQKLERRRRDWARRVLELSDDDPWRKELRRIATQTGSPRWFDRLCELADSPQLLDQPPRMWLYLGSTMIFRDRFEEGFQLLKRAQRRFPDDFSIAWKTGERARYRAGKLPKSDPKKDGLLHDAVRYFSIAAALRPDDVATLIDLANSLDAVGQQAEALDTLRSIDVKAAGVDVVIDLGHAYLSFGKATDAVHAASRAVALAPDFFEPHNLLIQSLQNADRFDDAIKAYENLLAIEKIRKRKVYLVPGDPRFAISLPEIVKNIRTVLHATKMLKLLERIAKEHSKHRDLPEVHRSKGDLYYFPLENWPRASNEFEKAMKLAKNDTYNFPVRLSPPPWGFTEFHFKRGVALARIGQRDDAIAAFEEALETSPNAPTIHKNLGLMLMQKGDFSRAAAAFASAVKNTKNGRRPYLHLGKALRESGHSREALVAFEQGLVQNRAIVAKSPQDRSAQADLLRALLLLSQELASSSELPLRDPVRAVKLASEAIKLRHNSAPGWVVLAEAQYRCSAYSECIETLQRVANAKEASAPMARRHLLLAMANFRLGRTAASQKSYAEAVRLLDRLHRTEPRLRALRRETEALLGIENQPDRITGRKAVVAPNPKRK